MTSEERDRLLREEGEHRGERRGEIKKIINQVLKKVQKGKELEVISEELEESVETIRPIYDAVREGGSDCDCDDIYERLYVDNE